MKKIKAILTIISAMLLIAVHPAQAQFQMPGQPTPTFDNLKPAQSPQWLAPLLQQQVENGDTAQVDPINVQFTWTPVALQLPGIPMASVSYRLKIVQSIPGMDVVDALNRGRIVYQVKNLMSPLCRVPDLKVKSELKPGETYVAEVTAEPRNLPPTVPARAVIQNEGRSAILIFQVKDLRPQVQ